MKIKNLFVLVLAAVATMASAQMPPVPDVMKSVDWMVGSWSGEMTMNFGGQESKSKSTMVCEKVLGGRYLRSMESFLMEGMGEMQGQLMMTYNPETKKWMSWWSDSMSPDTMESTGTEIDGAFVSVSKPTPMMGENVVIRSTMKKLSDSKMGFKLEMQQGTEWVVMMHGDYTKK